MPAKVQSSYTEAQWADLRACGEAVDAMLAAGDVRLSMGGEPTFVAAGDTLAAEWSIAALGPTKRAYADKLARRLLARFGPGGLLHYGQGKWYPGETQARWAFGVYWRADGQPLWRDPALIAAETEEPGGPAPDAAPFAAELCRQLGLPAESAIPAYEDAAYFMLVERKLPLGVAPTEEHLADAEERARIMRAFEQGLGRPTGYVLPLMLTSSGGSHRWTTERWTFKRGHLFLVPGDSPIGLRLPLGSLPEIAYIDYPDVSPADPFAPHKPLASSAEAPTRAAQLIRGGPVRTALAVEARDGRIGVFLPPLTDAAAYVALIGAIERAAAKLRQPIQLEGYPPPSDTRLKGIMVTPDPGVIEVNVHPARDWAELRAITEGVYADAAAVGLTAGKLRMDGRHVATGGGNHIVVGGITPADSPILRRPDLLASVLAYWHNHPALSYLFSGQFVGPTSQAPRIDEARHEALYELEIALERMPPPGEAVSPWLVDRIFRNLLVDVTGNTHRAEICIDKLYSPQGTMGRLGLLEFRAFEMLPEARMTLATQLLIRALIAWFWAKPYRQPLQRWGTLLHDRFMLPHALWADLAEVIADLDGHGLPMQAAWFEPHFEFRCPRIGQIAHAGVEVEVRQALEPWLVLGEDSTSGAASRIVDASLERIQVRLAGDGARRFLVTCNGYRVPLAEATPGERFAGVRYRAWQPTHGFHPTIPPHVPLTLHLVDARSGRAVAGCRYHATRPSGSPYDSLPADAEDARQRRSERFEVLRPGDLALAVKSLAPSSDATLTLDLRRT